jgi:hypothetical protein
MGKSDKTKALTMFPLPSSFLNSKHILRAVLPMMKAD